MRFLCECLFYNIPRQDIHTLPTENTSREQYHVFNSLTIPTSETKIVTQT